MGKTAADFAGFNLNGGAQVFALWMISEKSFAPMEYC